MLEVPGELASGAAKDMSSTVTAPEETPVTDSAYEADGELTCALAPTYLQTGSAEPVGHERPPYILTAVVMLSCSP
jgi:hypothetical protein